MELRLADKVVLVTGGSDGLGAALVRALSAEGAKVAFCARTQTSHRRAGLRDHRLTKALSVSWVQIRFEATLSDRIRPQWPGPPSRRTTRRFRR